MKSEILLYKNAKGNVKLDVIFEGEDFWLTQKQLADLFNVQVNTINYHLKEIFATQELEEHLVSRKTKAVASDGKSYNTLVYNLDVVISVGYRVNSYEATQFRVWATHTLKEYIKKGFILDDDRLKHGKKIGQDYFDELLERIREIRASERRFYQKITDIYSECSIDYDPKSPITRNFFANVQNKLEWAITGKTAGEIIQTRADASQPNMGLRTWKKAPDGKILKSDARVAKNYLNESEIKELNRIVTMYLDFAEIQAERQIEMKMKDWIDRLDAFLEFNGYDILKNAGSISKTLAHKIADVQFEKFRVRQDQSFESDFDKEVKKLKQKN